MTNCDMNATDCRCPTCRNVQPWSDECRRCGTDLSLLRRLAEESARLHRVLRAALATKNHSLAELTLKRLMRISPTPMLEQLLRFVNPQSLAEDRRPAFFPNG